MSAPIRVRRHTDGCMAFLVDAGNKKPWLVYMPWPILTPHGNILWSEERDVSGDGWSELFVAELPEPDGWADAVGDEEEDARTPYWTTRRGDVTAWTAGVEDDWGLNEDEEISGLRVDALKMLAAIAACERYLAERAQ